MISAMNRSLFSRITILGAVLFLSGCQSVKLENEFHTVVLDNNLSYLGRVENFGDSYIVLRQVYILQSHVDPATNETITELVRRNKEPYEPDRMIINSSHIVL